MFARSLFTFIALTFSLLVTAPAAEALECGDLYKVKEGDTLNSIADMAYGQENKWSLIFYANQKQFGNSTLLVPGNRLKIPCLKSKQEVQAAKRQAKIDNAKAAEEQIEVSRIGANIQLLTASDYAPFTDRALPAGGMITEIIDTAFARLQRDYSGPAFRVSWVDDWSQHLDPLLVRKTFDMGFPWFRPNCEQYDQLDKPAQFRCDKFFFSKPVFEILVLFFKHRDSRFQFASDDEVHGKRVCRPSGYFTFDLDKNGRNWVKEKKIELVQPKSVDECFRMLTRKEVDLVALNEFTGRASVKKLDLGEQVITIERPVSLLGLHVIVTKTHPRARTFLHYANSSIQRLRETGEYDKIVDKHLSLFWGGQESG